MSSERRSTRLAPVHLVLLTSSFPFGSGEEFLEDEIQVLAASFARVTIFSEAPSDSVRSLPPNCEAVSVTEARATSRALVVPRALHRLLGEWSEGVGVRRHLYMLRTLVHYLRKASAIARVVHPHVDGARGTLPLCFYSYWLDHKALAAIELKDSYTGSIAVSRAHGYDLYESRHPFGYLPLRRELLTRLTAVFPVSEAGARHLKTRAPGATNIVTSRLGVPRIASDTGGQGSALSGRRVVISIGSVIPVKRVSLLLDALRAFGPSSALAWRHFGNGPLLGALRRDAAAGLQIPHLFVGHVPNSELRSRVLAEAEHAVLVNTSASEGVPVSMMEAMACAVPCIGTDVGGVREIIQDGVNGYLLPADPSPVEIRTQIERYFNLPGAQRAEMCRAAFDTWATAYDASVNYSGFSKRLADLSLAE
jgi:colanic acid/amylovoran biosynthesis glycosyltransferase